jgi:hypothetical protein
VLEDEAMSEAEPLVQVGTKVYGAGKVRIYANAPASLSDRVAWALRAAMQTTVRFDQSRFTEECGEMDPVIVRAIIASVTLDDATYLTTKY